MSSKPRFVGEKVPFADAFTEVSRGTKKFKQSEYAEIGAHPIVDQGKEAIAGYSDEENGLFTDVPAIVFGDHTRCVKYVEEPFFAGADGVKILKPKLPGSTRFWWHALRATPIEDLGYSRHFKLLKATKFKVINETRQEEVVACLDGVLEQISYAEDQLTGFDSLVKSRFVEMFESKDYGMRPMGDLVESITAGTNVGGQQRPLGEGEYGVLKISAVTQGVFNPGEFKVVNDVSHIKMIHPRKGDLLFSRANTSEMVGATAIVDKDYGDLFLPDKLWRLDPMDEVETVFLKALLSSPSIRAEMSKVSTGSSGSMQNISMAKFRKLPAFLPPLALQQEFAAFVSRVDKSRFIAQQQIEKLQMLYDSLAQDYFGD